MAREIKVGFVGAGGMALEHAKAFSDIAGVQLVGITSRTSARAHAFAQRFGGMRVYASIDELYHGVTPDLLIVAVPELSILGVMRGALRWPWTILMEKPVGSDLAGALTLQAEARSSGAPVYVALNRRWLSSTLAARDDLDGNDGGRFIHIQDQQSQEAARALNHPPEVVSNWMYANSIHVIDLLAFFGRGSISAVEPIERWNPAKPGIVLAKVVFESGDLGLYQGIWNGPGPWACTVSTPRRRWEIAPLERAMYQNVNERRLNPVEIHAWDEAFKPGFRRQADETIRTMRGVPSVLPTLDDGVRSMQLTHDIFFGA